MNATPPTVFCVTTSATLKELSPLLGPLARVRWVPDTAAMLRMFAVHSPVAACLVESTPGVLVTLDTIRTRSPATRRLVLTDACDLRMVRELLDSGLVHELIYRPLDPMTLATSIGITPRPATATRSAHRSAASHA